MTNNFLYSTIALLVTIELFSSCANDNALSETRCIPDTLVTTHYVYEQAIHKPEWSFSYEYDNQETRFKYCCTSKDSLVSWITHLPDSILHRLRTQELVVEKFYYASDMVLEGSRSLKAKKVLAYDLAIEKQLCLLIDSEPPLSQLVFSTQLISSEEADRDKQESFVLQINRFRYQQEDYDQQATEDKK